jgi:hypothetical protein
MKQDNPFAKLGALDQKLYQDTTPKPPRPEPPASGIPEIQNSSNQEFQKSRKLDTQNSSNQEIKNISIPDIQNTSIQVSQNARIPETQKSRIPENPALVKPAKREFYTKATYRLCDEALDAIEDAKKILKRQFGLKVNLEEIVETAVLAAYKDLSERQEKSTLVTTYAGIPENKNS